MDERSSFVASGLVGREREQAEALAALDAALTGSGGLLLITGEAGIGKTRLIEELVGQIRYRTLWGACWDDPGTPAFWPWTSVLRDSADAVGIETDDDLAPIMGLGGPSGGPPHQLRLRLFDSMASFLRRAAGVQPLVIVLEDLHFADQASLDLLAFLATRLKGQPVAIVGSFRYPDLEPGVPLAKSLSELGRAARTVPLYGLDQDGVGQLIKNTTGTAASENITAQVRERTGGNPLFVIEVAKLFAAQGHPGRMPVPPSVQQVIAHRLGYISGETLDVLAQASVVGQVFSEPVLAQLTGERRDRLADLLDEATDAGLLRPLGAFGQFTFGHALVRDVLYAGIPSAMRRTRHRLVAEAIETVHVHALDDHVEELADHLMLALPDADTALALEYSRRAGRRSLGMLAHEQAARHFARAVELAESAAVDEDDLVELLLALGDAQLRAGDWQAAATAYEKVAASARRRHRPDELARAALGLGAGLSGFEVRLFDERQLDLLREALDQLDEAEPELRAWVLARLSVAESFVVAEGLRLSRSEDAVASARRLGDPKLLVYALSSYCDAMAGPMHTERRLQLAREMVQLGVEARDTESELLGRRFRLVALLESGDMAGVDAEITAFATAAARLRWPLVDWYPVLWRGTRALIEGRLDDSERLAEDAKKIGRRGGSVNAEIVADVQRLQLALERGRPGEAYELLGRFLDNPEGGPNADAWLALPLSRMGHHAEAKAVLDRLTAGGFHLVMDSAWLEVIASVAEACAEVGHRPAAETLLPLLQPYADRFATGALGGICFGSMNRLLGLLAHCVGRLDESDVYFRRALVAHRSAGATLLIAHTLRQHASLLRGRGEDGDSIEAEAMLAEANQTYRELGLEHWVVAVPAAPGQQPVRSAFRRDGDTWALTYDGRETRVRDVKGLTVIARLLAEPGREFHVLDLVGPAGRENEFAVSADTGEVIDEQARRAYQRRLSQLEVEIENATFTGDYGRQAGAEAEREALVGQLVAAYGLHGRVRHGNDPIERARSTVTKQIHGAIARIDKVHPSMALHLANSVRTGRYCVYGPEHAVSWEL